MGIHCFRLSVRLQPLLAIYIDLTRASAHVKDHPIKQIDTNSPDRPKWRKWAWRYEGDYKRFLAQRPWNRWSYQYWYCSL